MRSFLPRDIENFFELVRVPPPGNVRQSLSELKTAGLVIRLARGGWDLTPLGEQSVSGLSVAWHASDLPAPFTADFGGVRHQTVPPELAPASLSGAMDRFLKEHPFDGNVFAITRFPRPVAGDPISRVIASSREVLAEFGLTLHVASDSSVADELWSNIAVLMWGSRYGLAIVEDRVAEGVNKNVLIETGAMLATGRRCALLLDTPTVAAMPTDLVGHIRKDIDLADDGSLRSTLRMWCVNDLGMRAT